MGKFGNEKRAEIWNVAEGAGIFREELQIFLRGTKDRSAGQLGTLLKELWEGSKVKMWKVRILYSFPYPLSRSVRSSGATIQCSNMPIICDKWNHVSQQYGQ